MKYAREFVTRLRLGFEGISWRRCVAVSSEYAFARETSQPDRTAFRSGSVNTGTMLDFD